MTDVTGLIDSREFSWAEGSGEQHEAWLCARFSRLMCMDTYMDMDMVISSERYLTSGDCENREK